MSESRRIIIAMDNMQELHTLGVPCWQVPSKADDRETWAGWSEGYGGYFVTYADNSSNTSYTSSPFLSLPLLMEGTWAGVEWDEADPEVLDELRKAPELMFEEIEQKTRHQAAVAQILGLAS